MRIGTVLVRDETALNETALNVQSGDMCGRKAWSDAWRLPTRTPFLSRVLDLSIPRHGVYLVVPVVARP